ncbi:MAG: flagellar biosynthesis protein FlgB [Armatimonadetes bacterium]|nr:flagellar biosynthesis protein FlgB [Armatimonadota bacterium]
MIQELENALDTLAERQRVVARNLSNVNTPGYTRSDIDFFSHMREVFAGKEPKVEATPDTETPVRLDGNNVTLEREMFALNQSEVMYQVASRFATGAMQRMRYAVTEGRG